MIKLTHRQIEVLVEMSKGLSNKQIARRLKCVESTIKIHARTIYTKLDVNNRTKAAVWWNTNKNEYENH